MNIQIVGTLDEISQYVPQIRAVLGGHQVSGVEPLGDGSAHARVTIVTELGPINRGVSGEAVTSPRPRVWAIGDRVHRAAWNWTGTVKQAMPDRDRYSVYWDHCHDRPVSEGSSWCNSGELTEVLPEVSSSPRKEGEDRG